MRFELSLDRAGLWLAGLGLSLHVARERRAKGAALGSWWRSSAGSRSFHLGGLAGVVSKG
jgi:hypothetical protein